MYHSRYDIPVVKKPKKSKKDAKVETTAVKPTTASTEKGPASNKSE
jgi:hypothetical protein